MSTPERFLWRADERDTYEIARLTGPGSINRTDSRWRVHGADLGHMFEHDGALYMVFGDTFGPWGRGRRCNTLAWASDPDPWRGMVFDGMVTDRRGRAAELIGTAAVPGEVVTVIPTYGVSAGGRMVLHYMAVRRWGPPGRWWVSGSGLASSGDHGHSWRVHGVWWPGGGGFGQVAIVPEGAYLYLFGIPAGRFGGVRLARVRVGDVLDPYGYTYWNGRGWAREGLADAVVVVEPPVGELSVRWNPYYARWLMTYLNHPAHAVVLRTSRALTGPWSDESPVVTATRVPRLYAPYIAPGWNDGPDVFFTLSRFDVYDVFWWHTSLVTR
ncbi:MAG: DUF4185 domain-containing protein [Streptosporangiaceae bacterium]